jgi:DNA-binding NarL/FixJ family response regulator
MLRAFNAGAVGYLTEERFKPEIGAALRAFQDGKIYISPGITQGASPEAFLQKLRRTNFSQQFTVREHEILECMRKRMSNREIAEELSISITTAKSHKEKIMDKLGIHKSVKIAQYLVINDLA